VEEIEYLVTKAADSHVPLADRLAAFGQLVQRFQDMVYGCAYAILGDFHLAQDAAQEAFLTAYRELPKLRQPKAFPGWLRRIVISQCRRITRRKRLSTTALDTAAAVPSTVPQPAEAVERREMKDKVLAAIRALPEHQRMATTLFYINGYSQKDIAEFLEVPITTVKKRLADSRTRLKERMIAMVEETLHKNAPDQRFSKKVIEELLNRPRLLEIPGHPVRQVWEAICVALSNYEIVEGEEIVDAATFLGMSGDTSRVYQINEDRILRDEMTITTFQAMAGKSPPVRLLSAGRVFRPSVEDAAHRKVFHQVDGLCIALGVTSNDMESTCQRVLGAALGPVQLKWRDAQFRHVNNAKEMAVKIRGQWLEIGGCGMLTVAVLKGAGYDPQVVSGFAFGLGLDRLAMLKYGIDDVRKLWQSPYVPE